MHRLPMTALAISAAMSLAWLIPIHKVVASPRVSPAAVLPPQASSPRECGSWKISPGIDPVAPDGHLNAVTAISPTDVWAVGSDESATHWGNVFLPRGAYTRNPAPLAEHWNGVRWTSVPVPNPDMTELNGVAGAAANDVWAVGTLNPDVGNVIEHWNGKKWTVTQRWNQGLALQAVTAISRNDAWAVGGDQFGVSGPLIEHWNGKRWSWVDWQGRVGDLLAISATSPDNVWVGGFGNDGTILDHWNGKTWHRVGLPDNQPGVVALDVLSDTDVWVGGYSYIDHWNGGRWTVTKGSGPTYLGASGFAGMSAKNGWAVGGAAATPLDRALLQLLHWNGVTWTRVPSPVNSTTLGQLNGMASLGPGRAIAVGYYGARTATIELSGGHWTAMPGADTTARNRLTGVSAASPTDVWAVGQTQNQPFLERWNGSRWTAYWSPHLPETFDQQQLRAIDTISEDDAWAAGDVVEHWNGTRWRLVSLPRAATGDSFYSVASTGPDDVWLGGWAYGTVTNENIFYTALTYHWNGHTWTRVDGPGLQDIAIAVSKRGVWADQGALERWTGKGWVFNGGPDPSPYIFSRDIALNRGDIWEVGTELRPSSRMVARWDGRRWQVMSVPLTKSPGWLSSISVAHDGSIWAVGAYALPRYWELELPDGALVEQWNGSQWQVSQTPATPLISNLRTVSVSGDEVWAVGDYTNLDGTESHNLVESLRRC